MLTLPNLSTSEFFLLLPTDWLPYLGKQELQQMVDIIMSNPLKFLEFGLKAIAASLCSAQGDATRDALYNRLRGQLKTAIGNTVVLLDYDDFSHQLLSNLVFLARFSAHVPAHLDLTTNNVSRRDAELALEVFNWCCPQLQKHHS